MDDMLGKRNNEKGWQYIKYTTKNKISKNNKLFYSRAETDTAVEEKLRCHFSRPNIPPNFPICQTVSKTPTPIGDMCG